MNASYLFILNKDRDITDLPEEIRQKTDYHFRYLTNEHLTKLILLQKMEQTVNRTHAIFMCWDTDVELDDFQSQIHPKLYSILKYTGHTYGIFHRKIEELNEMDIKLIKEQKNYNNK